MSIKDAILNTSPTSYWPLDDLDGLSCHDEMGLHDASVPTQGVTLAVIPFGTSQAPYFDGALESFLTIGNDPKYSQPHANALTVAAWICPLALDNVNTTVEVAVLSTIEGLPDSSGNLLPAGCLPVPYPRNPGPTANEWNLSYRIGAVGIVGSARDTGGALA